MGVGALLDQTFILKTDFRQANRRLSDLPFYRQSLKKNVSNLGDLLTDSKWSKFTDRKCLYLYSDAPGCDTENLLAIRSYYGILRIDRSTSPVVVLQVIPQSHQRYWYQTGYVAPFYKNLPLVVTLAFNGNFHGNLDYYFDWLLIDVPMVVDWPLMAELLSRFNDSDSISFMQQEYGMTHNVKGWWIWSRCGVGLSVWPGYILNSLLPTPHISFQGNVRL